MMVRTCVQIEGHGASPWAHHTLDMTGGTFRIKPSWRERWAIFRGAQVAVTIAGLDPARHPFPRGETEL
jgi:hypothetical protein